MNRYQQGLMFLMLISILLSSCGVGDGVVPSPTPIATCPPENNVYQDFINKQLIDIYDRGVASVKDIDAYNKFRQQAFEELVNHIYASSDSREINSDGKRFRITITYINPEITQLIIVNHYLYKGIIKFVPGEMENQIKTQISGLIDKNEYVFFIIFAALQQNDGLTIRFPLNELGLTNTNDLNVFPEHYDQNLGKQISLTNEPEYGLFYFPMAVMKDVICRATLDINYDTRFRLNIPKIWVNDKEVGAQFWEFRYVPLIDMTTLSTEHQNRFSITQPIDQITPKSGPFSSLDLGTQSFWISMARMLWMEMTFDT